MVFIFSLLALILQWKLLLSCLASHCQQKEYAFFIDNGIDVYAIANVNEKPLPPEPFDPEKEAREFDEIWERTSKKD